MFIMAYSWLILTGRFCLLSFKIFRDVQNTIKIILMSLKCHTSLYSCDLWCHWNNADAACENPTFAYPSHIRGAHICSPCPCLHPSTVMQRCWHATKLSSCDGRTNSIVGKYLLRQLEMELVMLWNQVRRNGAAPWYWWTTQRDPSKY